MIGGVKLMGAVLADLPWGVTLILLPLAGGMICFLWQRIARIVGLLVSSVVILSVTGLGWQLLNNGVYRHAVGGWDTPLGINL